MNDETIYAAVREAQAALAAYLAKVEDLVRLLPKWSGYVRGNEGTVLEGHCAELDRALDEADYALGAIWDVVDNVADLRADAFAREGVAMRA